MKEVPTYPQSFHTPVLPLVHANRNPNCRKNANEKQTQNFWKRQNFIKKRNVWQRSEIVKQFGNISIY